MEKTINGVLGIHAYLTWRGCKTYVVGTGRQSNGFLLTPIENRRDLEGEKI